MVEAIAKAADLNAACRDLVDRANANGGPDNITVILARVEKTGLFAKFPSIFG